MVNIIVLLLSHLIVLMVNTMVLMPIDGDDLNGANVAKAEAALATSSALNELASPNSVNATDKFNAFLPVMHFVDMSLNETNGVRLYHVAPAVHDLVL